MIIVNKRVACTPFETTQTKTEVKGGLMHISQKNKLTKLTVVYESDVPSDFNAGVDLQPGDSVFLRGESCKHEFARQVFETEEGKPFILVPLDLIVGVE